MLQKDQIKPLVLKSSVQHYEWGTRNEQAFIPQLIGKDIIKDKPYAELWIGVHPKAPSKVKIDDMEMNLDEYIQKNPREILGANVAEKFNNQLPFLLKVLSAGEALSIQAHPNKKQAEMLHKRDPKNYPDDNHKPEIAIALDNLTALVGFKTIPELKTVLKNYQEMADFIGSDIVGSFLNQSDTNASKEIKILYSTLMQKPQTHEDELETSLRNLENRLSKSNDLSDAEELFLSLRQKYGTDVGLYSLFLLNLVYLKKGQGVFLNAGIPHAYLKGNIVECMANSDNVVRAGLTPKFKDVETLAEILTWETQPVPVMQPNNELNITHYQVPISEFQISNYKMEQNQKTELTCNSLHIILITEGLLDIQWSANDTESFSKGQVILVPALLKNYTIKASSQTDFFIAHII